MNAVIRMDARGRVTIGDRIAKNGIEPSAYWHLSFGPNQTVILAPVAGVALEQEAA